MEAAKYFHVACLALIIVGTTQATLYLTSNTRPTELKAIATVLFAMAIVGLMIAMV